MVISGAAPPFSRSKEAQEDMGYFVAFLSSYTVDDEMDLIYGVTLPVHWPIDKPGNRAVE
jgi:hypothetical protein